MTGVLHTMLMDDLNEIWTDIKKPSELSKSRLSDFFKFVVFGMPSKIQDPEGYKNGVKDLRRK